MNCSTILSSVLRHSALACLAAAPALAQAPGPAAAFGDRTTLRMSVRNISVGITTDVNRDSVADLLAFVPSASEARVYDGRNGRPLTLRGSTGTGFGRSGTAVLFLQNDPSRTVVVTSNGGITFADGASMTATGFVPTPTAVGSVRGIHVGELDGDPGEELVLVGSNGVGYFDGPAAASFVPLVTNIPTTDVVGLDSYVRKGGNGALDSIVVSQFGGMQRGLYEILGNSMSPLAAFATTLAGIDYIAEFQGQLIAATTENEFVAPFNATVSLVDETANVLTPLPVWNAMPDQRISQIVEPGNVGEALLCARSNTVNEEIRGFTSLASPSVLRVQAPPRHGLELLNTRWFERFIGESKSITVLERSTWDVSFYRPTDDWDIRTDLTYYRSGDTMQTTMRFGSSYAGKSVGGLVSLSTPMRLTVPGVLDTMFTFDPLTQVSGAFFGGLGTLDAVGQFTFSTMLPQGLSRTYDLSVAGVVLDPAAPLPLPATQTGWTLRVEP